MEPKLGSVWALKGQQPIVPTNSNWSRVNLTGFVDPYRGHIIVNTMPRGNSDNFIKQLDIVMEAYREKRLVTLYLDNARWHKTKSVYAWEKSNPSVKLAYLPKYAPEINPIERHWWYLRKETTQNVLFETVGQCWEAINAHFTGLDQEKIIKLCQI